MFVWIEKGLIFHKHRTKVIGSIHNSRLNSLFFVLDCLRLFLYVADEKQEFIEKAKLIASVLDESLSNLIATYLENYVKSYTEELKTIERL